MNEQLISFPVAKLAKEKGFDLTTDMIWANYYTGEPLNKWKLISFEEKTLNWMEWKAPTQAILQRWLREIHNIDIQIITNYSTYKNGNLTTEKTYRVGITYILGGTIESFFIRPNYEIFRFIEFKTYEEALEKGLYEALKLITII